MHTQYTHAHTHRVVRQPSPLQHMLGCVAEATLPACLTAASVCYEHGLVSTPLHSPSLCPPLLYASLSALCLTSIALSILGPGRAAPRKSRRQIWEQLLKRLWWWWWGCLSILPLAAVLFSIFILSLDCECFPALPHISLQPLQFISLHPCRLCC